LRLARVAPLALAAVLAIGGASGEELPAGAHPTSNATVVNLYSGKTAVWKDSDVYFAPDGTAKGVIGKPKITGVLMGTWAVSGNEMCLYAFRQNEGATFRDCYKYWRDDAKRLLALWSSHSDGTPVDDKNGYYTGELDRLKAGDLVSDKYAAAGGW
jgi:hypothetical protein